MGAWDADGCGCCMVSPDEPEALEPLGGVKAWANLPSMWVAVRTRLPDAPLTPSSPATVVTFSIEIATWPGEPRSWSRENFFPWRSWSPGSMPNCMGPPCHRASPSR